MSRLEYFLRSLSRLGEPAACPFCGSRQNAVVDRKYVATSLRRCGICALQYRHPPDPPGFNETFYQHEYRQEGLTTDLPAPGELARLRELGFAGSGKDHRSYVDLLRALFPARPDLAVVDYGASWGYTSFQFRAAGFRVQSFEIGASRAAFGNEHLGLDIRTHESDLRPGSDVFFSAHVVEHHPDVKAMVALGRGLLAEAGLFVALCPNGSEEFRARAPRLFHLSWGQVHPNLIGAAFYRHAFREHPYILMSGPYDLGSIAAWDHESQMEGRLNGDELLVVARLNRSLGRTGAS